MPINYPVKRFISLSVALKDLEPFVRNGEHLQTGKPFKSFGDMRSRELLANWLLYAAVNSDYQHERHIFTTDPTGGDGLILDTETGKTWATEHILVPRQSGGPGADIDASILKAIEKKQRKGGAAYASGKTLIILREATGSLWDPAKVARQLPADLAFNEVWVVGLGELEAGEFIYWVTRLTPIEVAPPIWRVRIAPDVCSWIVERPISVTVGPTKS